MYDKAVRRRRAVLVVLVALSLTLLTAYFGESSTGSLHGVQRGAMEVLAPIQEGANRVVKPFRDLFRWFGSTLKAKDERVCIALSDPHGAALYEYYAHGELRSRQCYGPKLATRFRKVLGRDRGLALQCPLSSTESLVFRRSLSVCAACSTPHSFSGLSTVATTVAH